MQTSVDVATGNLMVSVRGMALVGKVKDAEGRERGKTYNPINQGTATASAGASESADQSTVTNTYGANGGESLTKSVTNGGQSTTFDYTNPAGPVAVRAERRHRLRQRLPDL